MYFLFNITTLQVFVTYLTGALYVHPLWFYKHQHDHRVRSKLFVACQRWWFQWRFWFVSSVPGYLREEEERKPDPWRNPIERNHMGLHLENSYLNCTAYDKLSEPRQSFLITLYIRIHFVNASHSKPFVHTLHSTYSSVVSMLVVDVTSLCHALHISVEYKHVWYVHINNFHDIIGILWYTCS